MPSIYKYLVKYKDNGKYKKEIVECQKVHFSDAYVQFYDIQDDIGVTKFMINVDEFVFIKLLET